MNSTPTVRPVVFKQLRTGFAVVKFTQLFGWKGGPVVVAALLIFPITFNSKPGALPHPGAPRVISGDEPHYLIMMNSLVSDGDLNLANNYDSVQHGGKDAGQLPSELRAIEHHTRYAAARGSKTPLAATVPEYSTHQPGLALLFAPMLYPFRGTNWLEPMAILCSTLAVIGAFFFFRRLLRHMQAEESAINLVSGLAFLGTTVWFYGHSLFPEAALLLCICGAYTLGISRGSGFLAGLFLGAAIQVKAYYLLFALPLGLDYLAHRHWRSALCYSAPVIASSALFLAQNQIFFGNWRNSAQDFIPGSLSEGSFGLLFSLKWGLLFFSPVVVFALVFWPSFIRSHPREALLLGSAFSINFLLISYYRVWYGGNCVGPRYLVPFLPFLFVPLALRAYSPFAWRPFAKLAFAFLAILSIYANADAAIRRARYWDANPLVHYGQAAVRKLDKMLAAS